MTECMACDLTSGARPLPGGRLGGTEHWVVEHTVGPLGAGTLIAKPFRHVVHVADLDERETAELGPLLRRVSAAVTEVMAPEQVYVCLWSHAGGHPGHIHFVVQPVTRSDIERLGTWGPDLQVTMFRLDERPDPADIEVVCDRLRSVLARTTPQNR